MKKWIHKITKWQKQASFGLNILLVVGVIAALNFFSYQLFHRFDLTSNKNYSLSSASKELAGNLPDIINIKVYFSGNLPSQYSGLRQEVLDLLDEYQNYSKGRVKVQVIDPLKDKEVLSELRSKGIPEVQFNVLEKDKYQVVNGYMGMVISYGDKSEVVPVLQDVSNFEYLVSSDIKKLISEEPIVIGVLAGHDTIDWEKESTRADKALKELYQVQTVDLKTEKTIPSSIKALIIAGPKEKFNKDELKAIDKFVMGGGSLLLLVDGVKIDNGLAASKNELGMEELLSGYGITLNKDLVLDVASGMASFNQGFMTFNIEYPFWPKVTNGLDKGNPIVSRLQSIVLPWASSISISQEAATQNQVTYLAKTTNRAWHVTSNFNLRPDQVPSADSADQYTLAAAVQGNLKSPFDQGSTDKARIIVVGDSDFLKDGLLDTGDNLSFFQNMVDYLGLDEQLIGIRAKAISSHPLTEQLSDGAKIAVRYGNIFGITLIAVGFGLYRYYARRRTKREPAE